MISKLFFAIKKKKNVELKGSILPSDSLGLANPLALSPTSWETLGRFPNFSEPNFLVCKVEIMILSNSRVAVNV